MSVFAHSLYAAKAAACCKSSISRRGLSRGNTMKFANPIFCPPVRPLRVERACVQHRRGAVGRLRARHRRPAPDAASTGRCATARCCRVAPSLNTIIEFTHRATSGIDLALVALLLVWAFRAFPRYHRGAARRRAFGRLSDDRSAARRRPGAAGTRGRQPIVGARLFALGASGEYPDPAGLPDADRVVGHAESARSGRRTRGVDGRVQPRRGHDPGRQRGHRGAWATRFSLRARWPKALAQDFDPAASIFVRLRVLHPAIAALAAAWLVFYAVTAAARRPDLRPRAWLLLALLAGQVTAGRRESAAAARRCGCRWSTCCWPTPCGSRS